MIVFDGFNEGGRGLVGIDGLMDGARRLRIINAIPQSA
jgi:hypothetical protein